MNKNEIKSNLVIGNTIIQLDTVDSTNNYLSKLANETIVENGSVILAHFQTHGKGQRGNDWQSEKGTNLTLSIYLDSSFLKLSQSFLLSMMVCNSIHELLSTIIDKEKVKIKWPNDLLIENKKICGILIENSIKSKYLTKSIVGIGLNVNQKEFEENTFATSLYLQTSKDSKLEKLLNQILPILNKNYLILAEGNQLAIKNYYLAHLLGYKTELTYEWTLKNEKFSGEILEVMDNGLLKMRINQKEIKKIEMKEVRLLK